jgi:hypothetical protein
MTASRLEVLQGKAASAPLRTDVRAKLDPWLEGAFAAVSAGVAALGDTNPRDVAAVNMLCPMDRYVRRAGFPAPATLMVRAETQISTAYADKVRFEKRRGVCLTSFTRTADDLVVLAGVLAAADVPAGFRATMADRIGTYSTAWLAGKQAAHDADTLVAVQQACPPSRFIRQAGLLPPARFIAQTKRMISAQS